MSNPFVIGKLILNPFLRTNLSVKSDAELGGWGDRGAVGTSGTTGAGNTGLLDCCCSPGERGAGTGELCESAGASGGCTGCTSGGIDNWSWGDGVWAMTGSIVTPKIQKTMAVVTDKANFAVSNNIDRLPSLRLSVNCASGLRAVSSGRGKY